MGNQHSDDLPPLEIPKHHMLFSTMFGGSSILMYGTSHIKQILLKDGRSTIELDTLVYDCVLRRREILNQLLDQDRVTRKAALEFWFKYFKGIALNPWISPETFEYLIPFVEKYSLADPETAIRNFLQVAINIDDWVANWGYITSFLDTTVDFRKIPGYETQWRLRFPQEEDVTDFELPEKLDAYTFEPEIQSYIGLIVSEIKNRYNPKLLVDFQSFKSQESFTRGIAKGTLLYRGYRNYRGVIDTETNFAWFALNVMTTLSYMIPPEMEQNPYYLKGRETIDSRTSKEYCQAIGGTAVFRFRRDVQLLDFSSVHTMRYIQEFLTRNGAPKKIIDAFAAGWKIRGDSFTRVSQEVDDAVFVEWMCQQGFDGYIATGINIYDEILTCNFQEKIEYIGNYDPRTDMNFHMCSYPYNRYDLQLAEN